MQEIIKGSNSTAKKRDYKSSAKKSKKELISHILYNWVSMAFKARINSRRYKKNTRIFKMNKELIINLFNFIKNKL